MAIKKAIVKDGVPLNYHRIYNLVVNVNQCNAIRVFSYISAEERAKEGVIEDGEPTETYAPFITDTLIAAPYDPDMTITKAYEYLASLEEFKGAKNA